MNDTHPVVAHKTSGQARFYIQHTRVKIVFYTNVCTYTTRDMQRVKRVTLHTKIEWLDRTDSFEFLEEKINSYLDEFLASNPQLHGLVEVSITMES